MDRPTLYVNAFAGPGAGKTTSAWQLAAELKKQDYVTEYVPEYAKELVWDNDLTLLDGSFDNQCQLLAEQNRRLSRINGKVDIVVTDSPLLISTMYVKERQEEYLDLALGLHNQYDNFNLFINRGQRFEQEGRIHNLEESRAIDGRIRSMLKDNGIYYGSYYHSTLDVVVGNIQTTFNKLRAGFEADREAEAAQLLSRLEPEL